MSTAPVQNVFLLMLENHSFDNMFGFSGIKGINGLTGTESNTYNGQTYVVNNKAPESMPSDPGHEFQDTYQQLTGQVLNESQSPPYTPPHPAINNSGFVANYAISSTEATRDAPAPPPPVDYIDVMSCFNTSQQLSPIYQLATEFAICDNWFSSIPGPTWPNRFFAYAASSAGLDDSPRTSQMAIWELLFGVSFVNGSILDALDGNYQLYQDDSNLIGSLPIVSALQNVSILDVNSLSQFSDDLNNPDGYPYAFTIIEPNYGNFIDGTYENGSSQHPMDGVSNGEALIKNVYESLVNSPVWENSLLIITYDEHGGFYDHAVPPGAVSPGDGDFTYNTQGFDFTQLGVRVPAVIVSPYIIKGTVDKTLYDHTSILATVENLNQLNNLTDRDGNANDLLHLVNNNPLRTDCPLTLGMSVSSKPVSMTAADAANSLSESEPLPDRGNTIGFLQIAMKAEHELAGRTEASKPMIHEHFASLRTRGDAKRYIQNVMTTVQARKKNQ